MPAPDLKPYRLYLAMFLLNLAIVVGVIYLVRRDSPRPIAVTLPPTRTASSLAAPSAAPLSVRVIGAVKKPGTYTLAGSARLADAVQQAGGVRSDADLSNLDLTRALADGEELDIPARGAAPAVNSGISSNSSTPDAAPTAVPTRAVASKLNLNTATLAELDALPGIGPTLAQRILDYRTLRKGFQTIEQIKDVRGIGDKLFAEIKELITVQ